MSGKRVSEDGKGISEGSMTTVALQNAVKWHDELMLRFRLFSLINTGRNPKDSAVRSDLAKDSGVPESYLYRLAHKTSEMRSLDAEVYRLLDLAHAKYVRACERIEGAAEAIRQERLRLEVEQENAHIPSHRDLGAGSVAVSTATHQGEQTVAGNTIGGAAFRGQESGRQ